MTKRARTLLGLLVGLLIAVGLLEVRRQYLAVQKTLRHTQQLLWACEDASIQQSDEWRTTFAGGTWPLDLDTATRLLREAGHHSKCFSVVPTEWSPREYCRRASGLMISPTSRAFIFEPVDNSDCQGEHRLAYVSGPWGGLYWMMERASKHQEDVVEAAFQAVSDRFAKRHGVPYGESSTKFCFVVHEGKRELLISVIERDPKRSKASLVLHSEAVVVMDKRSRAVKYLRLP